jgi:hypothetical protein
MSKMGLHDPFGYSKHKLWPNERSGVNLPIWFPTTKSQVLLRFTCVQVASHILLEISRQGLQLCFKSHLNWRFAEKVMNFQSCRCPNSMNFKTLKLGVPGQNDIWVLASWPSTENTIRGEVVASPKSEPWWALWICVCPWFVRAAKALQLCTNQLVV